MVEQFKVQSWKCFFCNILYSFKHLINVCHSAAFNVISGKGTAKKSGAKTSLDHFGLWSYNATAVL